MSLFEKEGVNILWFVAKMNLGKPACDVIIGKTFLVLSDSCGLHFHLEITDSLVTLACKIKISHISSQSPKMLEHAHIPYCFTAWPLLFQRLR